MPQYSKTRYQTYELRNLSTLQLVADKEGYTLFDSKDDVDALLRSIPVVVSKGKMGYLDESGNEYAVLVSETSDYDMARCAGLLEE